MAPIFISVLFCASALGADRTNPNLAVPDERVEESATPAAVKKSDKKWFAGFDSGFGTTKYSGTLKTEIDAYRTSNSAERSPTINLEGYFAWRLGTSRTILGPTLAISYESYDTNFTSDLNVTNYFAGAMVEHYFDDEVKRGFFGRLDFGLVEIELSRTGYASADKNFEGTSIRVGFGYAIRAGEKIGIPIMLQYQYASLNRASEASTVMLTGGMIF